MIIYTPPTKVIEIPVIDLAADAAGVGRAIHRACRETGFFYVANHGISPALMADQLDWTQRLYALPEAAKMAMDFATSPRRLGYEPPLRQVLDAGSPPDLKESYMYAETLGGGASVPNLWPQGLPGFREQMRAYHTAIGALGLRLMRGIARSLEIDEDFFAAPYAGSQFAVRLLHYPPRPTELPANQLGAGAHTDWGGITLLLQDDRGGLEVRDADGDWIAKPALVPQTSYSAQHRFASPATGQRATNLLAFKALRFGKFYRLTLAPSSTACGTGSGSSQAHQRRFGSEARNPLPRRRELWT